MSASAQSTPCGRMHNLVLCGATNPRHSADAAMFADFMGVATTLWIMDPEVKGTFLSCFPLEEHFSFLGGRNPPITDIKWGTRDNGKERILYTKEKFERDPKKVWFKYLSPKAEGFYTEAVGWLGKKQQEAQPGDVVNVYFQCHGNHDGVLLGHKALTNEALTALFAGFRDGVQANAIGSHCHSGRLVRAIKEDRQHPRYIVAAAAEKQRHFTATRSVSNRIRQFRLAPPFMQSLGRAKLRQQHEAPPTIKQHDMLMASHLACEKDGKQYVSEYQSYLSPEKEAAIEELDKVLLRNYADVGFQKQTNSLRERSLWPSLSGPLNVLFSKSSAAAAPAARTAAENLVMATISSCDETALDIHDLGLIDNILYLQTPDIDGSMKILYWRSMQMLTVWTLFVYLAERGFLSFDSLAKPMVFRQESDEVFATMRILHCFEYVSAEYRANLFPDDFLWPVAFQWLATCIVRSFIKPEEIFEAIALTGVLGKLDVHLFKQRVRETGFPSDPTNMDGQESPGFGFWLPHGLGDDKGTWQNKVAKALEQHKKIEHTFNNIFQIAEDPLLQGLLPEEHDATFENPLKLAKTEGYRFSGLESLD